MSPAGLAFSDELLLTSDLTHEAAVVLAHWQDDTWRESGYRSIAKRLRMDEERVRALMRWLVEAGIVFIEPGGRYRNSRHITDLSPAYDRRRAKHFVVVPPSLLAIAVLGGQKNIALRLRYLALLCLDQQKRGLACVTDSEAAEILGTSSRSIASARRYLLASGAVAVHDRFEGRPIFAIEAAFVAPNPARFSPTLQPMDTRPRGRGLRDQGAGSYATTGQKTTSTTETTTSRPDCSDSLRSSSQSRASLADCETRLEVDQAEDDSTTPAEALGDEVTGETIFAGLTKTEHAALSEEEVTAAIPF